MKTPLLAAFTVALFVLSILGAKTVHTGYIAICENLYWQPNAIERMNNAGCDIDFIEKRIQLVKSGKYNLNTNLDEK